LVEWSHLSPWSTKQMGWFILKYIFSTFLAVLHIGRLSNQEKDLIFPC